MLILPIFRCGFQIASGTDFGPRILEQKKGSKSYLLEENLKIMTKDRQQMKKATISYKKTS